MRDFRDYRPPAKDNHLWSAKKIFAEQLQDNGEDILVDGVPVRALITTYTNPLNENKEDRRLRCLDNVEIKKGSYVEYEDNTWMVFTKPKLESKVYKLCKILECNDVLTFQDKETLEIITKPCILLDKSSVYNDGLKTGVITLQDDQIAIKVPFHPKIAEFPIKKRFIFQHSVVYELTQVDILTQKGLITLTMKRDQESKTNDNFDLNIADYIEPNNNPEPPEPTEITINGSNEIKLNQTNTYTVESTNSILFSLKSDDGNDTSLATITEQVNNTCKVKASGTSTNVGKYFRLYAGDGTNENYIRIMVKSLF